MKKILKLEKNPRVMWLKKIKSLQSLCTVSALLGYCTLVLPEQLNKHRATGGGGGRELGWSFKELFQELSQRFSSSYCKKRFITTHYSHCAHTEQ